MNKIRLLSLFCLVCTSLSAEKRLVIKTFTGQAAESFQADIEAAVGEKHILVSDAKYKKAARKLGVRGKKASTLAKVARKLKADGIIVGRIDRKGKKFRLRVRLQTAEDGSVVKDITLVAKRLPPSEKSRNRLKKQLLKSIDKLPRIKKRDNDWDQKKDDESTSSKGSDDRSLSGTPRVFEPGMLAFFGVMGLNRKLTFTSRPGLEDKPAGYPSKTFPGATMRGTIFPALLAGEEGIFTHVGLTGSFKKATGLDTTINGPDGIVSVPTKHHEWTLGGLIRIAFGEQSGGSVAVGARYGRLFFSLNKNVATGNLVIDVPSVTYSFVEPEIQLRYHTGKSFGVGADIRYSHFLKTGHIQRGIEYGRGKVTGFDADAFVDIGLHRHVAARVGAGYRVVGFDFDGSGDLTNNRDGDPNSIDVGGAKDSYLTFYAMLGTFF